MNNAKLINQTSGKVEYYTPVAIIEAARKTMGSIDLDPASSQIANERIGAEAILTVLVDGLTQTWWGNVWMNHPFGRESNPLWIKKLVVSYIRQEIKQACCITYACTSEKWFQPLFAFPMCFLSPRTDYLLPDGTVKDGVTKGSVVTYLGPNIQRFKQTFRNLGAVMVPIVSEE